MSLIYLSLPRMLAGVGRGLSPGAMRILSVAFLGAGIFLPTAIGFFLDIRSLEDLEHAGNPIWVIGEVVDGDSLPAVVVLTLAVLVVLATLISIPRVVRALKEVRDCSAMARERLRAEAAAHAPTSPVGVALSETDAT